MEIPKSRVNFVPTDVRFVQPGKVSLIFTTNDGFISMFLYQTGYSYFAIFLIEFAEVLYLSAWSKERSLN